MGPGSRFAWPGRQRASPRLDLARAATSSAALCIEGHREGRAPTAPAAPCAKVTKESTRIRQVQPRHPGLPRAKVLRLIRALPGERPFLPPSPMDQAIGLTPGSRRQDHTTSPYAANVLVR